jgi:hypothetical protein
MRAYRLVRLVWALGVAVSCSIVASHADAQPSSNSRVNFVINGAVNAAARVGNTLYIGGAFSRIAPSANALGTLVAVNPSTAQVIPGRFPLVVGGDVTTLLPDGSGGYYIGGGFDRIGGDRQPNLRRIDANGQLVPAFVPSPGFVRALALAGGHLWVGGDFTFVSGQPRQRLAAIDPVTGAARAFATDANNSVFAIAVSGTQIIVAGSFTQIAGQARNRLAAFDATTGALLPWNPGADNTVNALAVDATSVFVGGSFTTVGGVARARLAAVDPATGATILGFAPPAMTNTVNTLLRHGPALYAGGNFQITVGGVVVRNNAASFSPVTGATVGWVPNIIGGAVNALKADGDLIYIGGGFSQVAGQPRTGIVAVNASTAVLSPWNPGLIRGANAIEIASDGAVIAGGGANATGGATRFNLAAIDMVSGELLPFAPSTGGAVLAMTALEVDDDVALIIGGNFLNVSGQPRTRIAVLDEDGDVDDFNPGADNSVNAIRIANGQVYVGGAFTTVAGQPRAGLASFSIENEGALTDWAPAGPDGSVLVLEPGDGVMYVGGNFNTIGGAARSSVAAIDVNTGTATAFNANLSPRTVLSLERAGSTLYIGDLVNGLAVVDAVSGAPTGAALPTLQPAAPVRGLAVQGNTLYVGGGLFNVGAVMRRGLAGIDLSQSPAAPTAWSPDAGYNVNAVYAFPDVVVAVGNFNRTNPVPAAGLGVWERTSGVPAPPLNFRAGAVDNLASLQWTAPALGPAATGYTLEVGSTPTSGNDIATFPLGNVTSFSASAPTATFYVRLRATNAAGDSEPTPTLRIDSGCTAPPGPPSFFNAFVDGSAVDLEWSRGQGNVARYLLEVGSSSGLSNILTTSFPVETTSMSAVAPAGTYFLRVRAANACGTGAASSEVSLTIGSSATFPGSPTNLTATVSGANVSLSWTAPTSGSAPTGYVVEAGSANGLADVARIPIGPGTTFSSGPVVPPGTYYVRVRAVNGAGTGPLSNGVVVVVR